MKLRSLLFDAGCTVCTGLAKEAEAEARGWLQVRPLQDPAMRELLDKHAPGLGRRPALVTQDGDRVTVDTGAVMLAKLLAGVGPGRCWRLLRKLAQAQAPRAADGRRSWLRAVGGGTLASVGGLVMAQPSGAGATKEESTTLVGEKRDEALAAVRAEVAVRVAENRLLEMGFALETDSAVIVRGADGSQLTMIFYPDVAGRADRAGVVVHERLADGSAKVQLETMEGEPQALLDASGRLREGALRVTSSARIAENGVIARPNPTPDGVREYISCMVLCLGANCGRFVAGCTRLPFLYLVLACIVGYCGTRARPCHGTCRRYW